jgi:hypothetical protein
MSSRISVSRTTATVGDPIAVTVSVNAPAGSTVEWKTPAPAENIVRKSAGPWKLTHTGSVWNVSRTETWAAFSPDVSLSLNYDFRVSRDGRTLQSGHLVSPEVRVASVIPRSEQQPRPAPLEPPRAKLFIPWELVAGGLAVILLAAAIVRFLRRRRGAEPALTPDEIFEQELWVLARRLESEEPDEAFFDRLAENARTYLEQVLRFPAGRQTSTEIIRSLRRDPRGLPATEIDFVLLACDESRFAKREVRLERARQAIEAARLAAERIRHVLAPPAEEGLAKSA